jgi:hypothetical protein
VPFDAVKQFVELPLDFFLDPLWRVLQPVLQVLDLIFSICRILQVLCQFGGALCAAFRRAPVVDSRQRRALPFRNSAAFRS